MNERAKQDIKSRAKPFWRAPKHQKQQCGTKRINKVVYPMPYKRIVVVPRIL